VKVEIAAKGLDAHQDEIGIKQVRADVLRAAVTRLQTAENAFQTARSTQKQASDSRRESDLACREFLLRGKNVLTPLLGFAWSMSWVPVGFASPSLRIPTTMDGRLTALAMMEAYLAQNPAHENFPLNVTSAAAAALGQTLQYARSTANNAVTLAATAKHERDNAFRDLSRLLICLVAELNLLLGPDSPQWYGFGLNCPSAPETPEVPENLVISPAYQNHALATWDQARRASYYRVWRSQAGESTFTAIQTATNPQALLNSLASGTAIRVYVTAVNDAGESQPSQIVDTIMP
jgi:hypothetical protein